MAVWIQFSNPKMLDERDVIRRLSALEAKVDALTAHVGALAAVPRPPPLALAVPASSPALSPRVAA